LRVYAEEEPKGQKVGDLLCSEEQMVEGLDAVLVLREDRWFDIYWPGWEEEYSLPIGFGDDSNEAFDLGYSRSGGY
jgi:hypothetical protein